MPEFLNDPVHATSTSRGKPALTGEGSDKDGVVGICHNGHGGVVGINDWGGDGSPGSGGNGGWFESAQGEGVRGWSKNPNHGGVVGVNTAGGQAVYGTSDNGTGVMGESKQANGVLGVSHHPANAAISAVNVAGGLGLWAESQGGQNTAAHFRGKVEIDGDLTILNGKDIRFADFAEDFDRACSNEIAPGAVVVLDADGLIRQSHGPYDRRVAGVVAGAGEFRSAITLDRNGAGAARTPVALMGKVYCKVDARCVPVAAGDLLTTAATPGHAMKASDRERAFGAVIGKALRPMAVGECGLLPILVALQ